MAFTVPSFRPAGLIVMADIFNTDLVDNLIALREAADQEAEELGIANRVAYSHPADVSDGQTLTSAQLTRYLVDYIIDLNIITNAIVAARA